MSASQAVHTRDTLPDAVTTAEVDLLLDIARIRRDTGSCIPGAVCQSWERVATLMLLKTNGLAEVVEQDVRLTALGEEWVAAFGTQVPCPETERVLPECGDEKGELQ